MFIHHLQIENFRGIASLDSTFGRGFTALVGPGDSGKTTVLDALSFLFHPHWALNLTDNDFLNGSPENEIRIRATVADPPIELLGDRAFFSHLRGIDAETGNEVDEPEDHIPALTCELRVGADFEPAWKVICDRHAEGLTLSAASRRKFGVRRITSADSHLRWNSSSSLQQLTDRSEAQETETVLRQVSREARVSAKTQLEKFDEAVQQVTIEARRLRAIDSHASLTAELDADVAAMTRGSVALHDNGLPVARGGLGSRRLVSIGVQTVAEAGANVLLIDELESGLEPSRIRHLLRHLGSADDVSRQVFATTHSPIVLRELRFDQLKVLRNATGTLELLSPLEQAQATLRIHTEAFLAPKVLVCEGATEVGFVRQVSAAAEVTNPSLIGVAVPTDAGGDSKIQACAMEFHRLKYQVAILCDDDNPDLEFSDLPGEIVILRCDAGVSIEQQVIHNLNADGLRGVLDVGVAHSGRDSVASRLLSAGLSLQDVEAQLDTEQLKDGTRLGAVGTIIATAAMTGKWFKSVNGGEELGRLASDSTLSISRENLDPFVDRIAHWCVSNG